MQVDILTSSRSIEKCADEGTWALLTSQIKPETISNIGRGEPITWDLFWPQVYECLQLQDAASSSMFSRHICLQQLRRLTATQVEAALKSGVKEYMRKVVKTEILAKFTEWRRKFHEIFTAADENADGAVPAVSFVSCRGERFP